MTGSRPSAPALGIALFLALSAVTGTVGPVTAQQVYRCVDQDGKVHIGVGSAPVGVQCAERSVSGKIAPSRGDGGAKSAAEASEAARPAVRCQAAVRARLKAPATARFVSVYHDPRDAWAVVGEVEARNSAGKMMRGSYACKLRGGAVEDVTVTVW